MDVVFYEVFREEEKVLRDLMPEHLKAEFTPDTIQAHGDKEAPASLISIRTQSIVPASWAGHIKGILTRSTGYDHLLAYRAQAKTSVPCGYLDHYCSRAVAEHVLTVMLALSKNLKTQITQLNQFNRNGLTGQEIHGKNLLVVGVGNIGSCVVDLAKGLHMHVKGVDINPTCQGIEYVSLQEGLVWADIIVVALPLTDDTQGLFNYDVLKTIKQGALLINIARAEISPVEDLKRVLDEGVLGGLSLDVYPQEGILAEFLRGNHTILTPNAKAILELKDHKNVLFTPHNAFNTHEAVREKAQRSINSVVSFLSKQTFPFPVPQGPAGK